MAAVESEALAFPHLTALLSSLAPSAGPSTRARAAAAATAAHEGEDEEQFKLEPTQIPELTVDGGMDSEMIWEQMELRGKSVDGLMEAMFGQNNDEEDEEGGSGEEEEDEDEEGFEGLDGEDADMLGMDGLEDDDDEDEEEGDDGDFDLDDLPQAEKEEYFRKLAGGDSDDEDGSDAEPAPRDPLADDSSALTLDNFDGAKSGRRKDRTARCAAHFVPAKLPQHD